MMGYEADIITIDEIDDLLIIEELNDEHHKTKFPIVYTSADSVFQIALDTDLIPLETLYKWCEIARKIPEYGGPVFV